MEHHPADGGHRALSAPVEWRAQAMLCALADLPDPGGRGFVLRLPRGGEMEMFVVRLESAVFGYRNRCPHAGTPLDWVPNRFLSHDGRQIVCGTHDALFGIEDGRCTEGPCVGDHLEPVPVAVAAGQVLLAAGPPDAV